MANQEKEDGSNSIRVVDDESPNDFVRLDAPKRSRLEKRGGVAAVSMEARHRDATIEEQEVHSFDPEEGWRKEQAGGEARAVPMGWFVLLGAVLLGVLAWAGSQIFFSSEKPEDVLVAGGEGGALTESGLLGRLEDERAMEDAAKSFEKTEEVLRDFLNASTIEEKARYVRHPERVMPLMEDHYSRNELKQIVYSKISEYLIFPLEKRPFLALEIEDSEGGKHAVLLEDKPEGVLVDWESFVCFQPVVVADYVSDRPPGLVALRVYVSADYFHSYEFDDREEYASFRLRFRDSEILLNGYVKRGTELEQKFRTLFPDPERSRIKPLIVTVRFLEGGKAKRSVLIESLESAVWAYPSDPAEVASSEESR